MNRITISWGLVVACLALFATASKAADLTISIPSCTSYSLTGTTITCTTGGTSKACTVSGASSGVTGSPLTLNGSCTGFTPASTAWTGCSDQTATTCTVRAAGTVTFTGFDDVGAPFAGSKTVTFSAPSCSITGATTGVVGAGLILGTSCNFTPTSFLWTGCDVVNTNATCVVTKTVTGTYPITVTASDTSSHSASANTQVTFNSASGAMPASCTINTYGTGVAKPTVLKTIAANGGDPITTFGTSTYEVDSRSDAVVMAQFKVPAASGIQDGMSYAEFGSLSTNRSAYASKTPCDMSATSLVKTATSGTIKFNVGTLSGVSGTSVNMKPGETWYVMIINYNVSTSRTSGYYLLPTTSSCPAGTSCSMRLGVF